VSGGSAATTFTSWGYANGTHTVRAYDCTAYGECSTHATSAQFSIANPASSITTPKAGAGVTGLVQVQATNPAGGPLRLLVDGHSAGSRSAAPYTFSFSASDLKDGPHSLVTQGCSSDYQRCSGPRSSAVSVRSQALHPTITGIAPWQFSPNADHVKDATTLTYRLPQSETVYAAVLDSHGTRVRYAPLGTQPAGTHTWVWHGKRGDGTRLPDGRYTVALDTRRGALRGWVHTSTIIDTRRPTLSHTAGANRLFYPVPDGYRDAFTPSTTTNSPGWLHLTIETLHGRTVQVVNAKRSAGLVRISWHGRDKHRHLVAPGTYRWRLALTDAAGNVGHTRWFKVRVSGKRLVRRTQYVTLAGARAEASGGTASCASARRSASAFAGGLYLLNRCSMNDFDLAYVSYHFHLPKAYRYDSVALQARGLSRYVPSELSAAFEAVDGSVAIPRYEKVGHYGTHWFPVASVGGRGHVSAHGYVRVSLLLDSYYSGRNDFDIESVRLRVRLTVLR
jgi:flagellar hook assembly protein FlgD